MIYELIYLISYWFQGPFSSITVFLQIYHFTSRFLLIPTISGPNQTNPGSRPNLNTTFSINKDVLK
jgi:hypothetical protein